MHGWCLQLASEGQFPLQAQFWLQDQLTEILTATAEEVSHSNLILGEQAVKLLGKHAT